MEVSRGAQENTRIETIKVDHALTDITNFFTVILIALFTALQGNIIFKLDAGDILHIDERVAGVAVHHQCNLPIAQFQASQFSNQLGIKQVICHKQQKRFVQHRSGLEHRKAVFLVPVIIHRRRDLDRKGIRQTRQEMAKLLALVANDNKELTRACLYGSTYDTFNQRNAQKRNEGLALTPGLQPAPLARCDDQALDAHHFTRLG